MPIIIIICRAVHKQRSGHCQKTRKRSVLPSVLWGYFPSPGKGAQWKPVPGIMNSIMSSSHLYESSHPWHELDEDGENTVVFLTTIILDDALMLEVSQQLHFVLQGTDLLKQHKTTGSSPKENPNWPATKHKFQSRIYIYIHCIWLCIKINAKKQNKTKKLNQIKSKKQQVIFGSTMHSCQPFQIKTEMFWGWVVKCGVILLKVNSKWHTNFNFLIPFLQSRTLFVSLLNV